MSCQQFSKTNLSINRISKLTQLFWRFSGVNPKSRCFGNMKWRCQWQNIFPLSYHWWVAGECPYCTSFWIWISGAFRPWIRFLNPWAPVSSCVKWEGKYIPWKNCFRIKWNDLQKTTSYAGCQTWGIKDYHHHHPLRWHHHHRLWLSKFSPFLD